MENNSLEVIYSESAFKCRLQTFIIKSKIYKDPRIFLESCFEYFEVELNITLVQKNAVKVITSFEGEFEMTSIDVIRNERKYFATKNKVIFKSTNLKEWYHANVLDKLLNSIES